MGLSALTSANIGNTDGWIVVTNSSDNYTINWNTTRPSVCGPGQFSYWDGSNFNCGTPVNLNTSGVNETGYSIHGCGGSICDTGFYSTGY